MNTSRIMAGAVVLGILSFNTAVQAADLRLLTAWVPKYPANPIFIDPFVAGVKKATAGKTNITIHGPDVVSPFEQFEPTSKGAFDILFTVASYHLGTNSVPFSVFAIDPDPVAFRKNGIFDMVDKAYQKNNLKLLAIFPANAPGSGGYHAMLTKPVDPAKGIEGRKVRSVPTFQAMVDSLGASGVTIPVSDVYSNIQRGVVDGAFGPVVGSLDYKWAEVAPFMMRPVYGNVYLMLLMNLDKYNKLPADERNAIGSEAEKLEVPGMHAMEAKAAEEIAAMKKQGAKETTLDKARFEKALKAFNGAFWTTAMASKATPAEAKAFYEFAKSKNLAE